jgi:hypothetical protein
MRCSGVTGSRNAAMRPMDAAGGIACAGVEMLRVTSAARCTGDGASGAVAAALGLAASFATRPSSASPPSAARDTRAPPARGAPTTTRPMSLAADTVDVASGTAEAARGSAKGCAAGAASMPAWLPVVRLAGRALRSMRCTGAPSADAVRLAVCAGGVAADACSAARDANARTPKAAAPGRASARSVSIARATRSMRGAVAGDDVRDATPGDVDIARTADRVPRAASRA